MRMMRLPSEMSATDTTIAMAILTLHPRSEDQPHGVRSSLLRVGSELPSGRDCPNPQVHPERPWHPRSFDASRSENTARQALVAMAEFRLDRTGRRCLCGSHAIASRVTTNAA